MARRFCSLEPARACGMCEEEGGACGVCQGGGLRFLRPCMRARGLCFATVLGVIGACVFADGACFAVSCVVVMAPIVWRRAARDHRGRLRAVLAGGTYVQAVRHGAPLLLWSLRALWDVRGGRRGVRCVRGEGFCAFARCMRATRLVLATVLGVIGACASADGACLLCHVWL